MQNKLPLGKLYTNCSLLLFISSDLSAREPTLFLNQQDWILKNYSWLWIPLHTNKKCITRKNKHIIRSKSCLNYNNSLNCIHQDLDHGTILTFAFFSNFSSINLQILFKIFRFIDALCFS